MLKNGGVLFESSEDLIEKIDVVSGDLNSYRDKVRVHTLSEIADKYINFFNSLTY